jgi:hypothetical protein
VRVSPAKHLLALFRQQAQNDSRWRCPSRLLSLLLTFLVVAFIAVFPAQTQQGLTNTDIIKIQSAGLSESIILSSVNTQPAAYDTSTDVVVVRDEFFTPLCRALYLFSHHAYFSIV